MKNDFKRKICVDVSGGYTSECNIQCVSRSLSVFAFTYYHVMHILLLTSEG
jgi:hypothetical protein